MVGATLNPINSSLIATALIPIGEDLGIGTGEVVALVAALYLASAVAQPTAGRAADLFGARRVFIAGAVMVLVGGVLGGLAQSLGLLVLARVLIGVGTSSAFPTAMVLIRERARIAGLDGPPGGVIGGLQIAAVATASLGLPLGGLLVDLAGWRSVLVVNVPLAPLTLLLAARWIPRDSPLLRRSPTELARVVDPVGILGFAGAMTLTLLFAFSLPAANWWLLAAAVVVWALEVVWERRCASPFLDVRALVSNAALARTYLRYGLVLLAAYLALYGLTQWMQVTRDVASSTAGLLLLPMTLVSGLVIPAVTRRGLIRGPLLVAAAACAAAGLVGLLLPSGLWLAAVLVVGVLLGLATGTAAGNTLALYRQAAPAEIGTASGLMRSAGYVGSIASSAVIAVVFQTAVTDGGVLVIAIATAGIGLVLVLVTALDRSLRPAGR